MPLAELVLPEAPFQLVSNAEFQLRPRYLLVESQALPDLQAREVVEKSAVVLELAAAASCVFEFCDGRVLTAPLNSEESARLVRRVRQRCGLDLVEVSRQALSLRVLPASGQAQPMRLSMVALVRAMRALLEICPISRIEAMASDLGMEATGHRCRVAFDALKAFVIRNDPRQQRSVVLLGQKYQEGALEIDEVATLLNVHPVDAVALLEEGGFSRPFDVAQLSREDRAAILAGMRKERLGRSGRPVVSAELVGRNVIASARIEGVDARRWIPREGLH